MGYDTITLKEASDLRRSIYQLSKTSSVSDAKLKEIIEHAITTVPSSFNSQSTRLVVLVREDHDKFWDLVHNIVKELAPPDAQEKTAARMAMFKGAFGTILFYEDPEPIKKLQSTYAIYSEYFPQWSEHSNAMHQFYLWAALEAEGLGANLQHYNPVANQKTADTFGIPQEWQLKGQLVFGDIAGDAREKLQPRSQTLPLEQKVTFHGL